MGTVVAWAAELFSSLGSGVPEPTEAMLVNVVPGAAAGGIFTTRVNVPEAPKANGAAEQLTVPPEPAGGAEQEKPAGAERETKVIPAGIGSVNVTPSEESGPKFETVIVYDTLLPAAEVSGPVLATPISAL